MRCILACHRHVFALATTCLSALSIGEAVLYDDACAAQILERRCMRYDDVTIHVRL